MRREAIHTLYPIFRACDPDRFAQDYAITESLIRIGWLWLPQPDQLNIVETSDLRPIPNLRGRFSIPRGQGHVRKEVQISWTFQIDRDWSRYIPYLISLFQLSPFVPVDNITLNFEHDILGLALHRLTFQTSPSQPNLVKVLLEAYEFEALSYLPYPLQYCLCYPIYEAWVRTYAEGETQYGSESWPRFRDPNEIPSSQQPDMVFQMTDPAALEQASQLLAELEAEGSSMISETDDLERDRETAEVLDTTVFRPFRASGMRAYGLLKLDNWMGPASSGYVTLLPTPRALDPEGRGVGSENCYLIRISNRATIQRLLSERIIIGYVDLGPGGSLDFRAEADVRNGHRAYNIARYSDPVLMMREDLFGTSILPGSSRGWRRYELGKRNSYLATSIVEQGMLQQYINQHYLSYRANRSYRNCLWVVRVSSRPELVRALRAEEGPGDVANSRQPVVQQLIKAATTGKRFLWVSRTDGEETGDLVCPVVGYTVTFEHGLAEQQLQALESPTFSYLGSLSASIQIQFSGQTDTAFASLKTALSEVRSQQRNYSCESLEALGFEVGFVRVHDGFLNSLGIRWLIPQVATWQPVEGQPNLRMVSLSAVAYEPVRVLEEQLRERSILGSRQLDELLDFQREARNFAQFNDCIDQIELYPDLHLPRYGELEQLIQRCLERYPELDRSQLLAHKDWQDPGLKRCFVDPDFYVGQPRNERRGLLDQREQLIRACLEGTELKFYSRIGEEAAYATEKELYEQKKLDLNQGSRWAITDPQAPRLQPRPKEVERSVDRILGGEIAYSAPPISSLTSLTERMFEDELRTNQPRLVRAFPTAYLAFYNEGRWLGAKRLWDRFLSGLSLVEFKLIQDWSEAADLLTLTVYDYGQRALKHSQTDLAGYGPYRLFDAVSDFHKEYLFPEGPDASDLYRWEHSSDILGVQAGTRVHLRFGCGSIASALPVKFNGRITEYTPNDQMVEIVCQGDGCELLEPIVYRTQQGIAPDSLEANHSPYILKSVEARNLLLWLLSARRRHSVLARRVLRSEFRKWRESFFGVEHFGVPPLPIEGLEWCTRSPAIWGDACLREYHQLNGGVGMNIYCMGDRPGRKDREGLFYDLKTRAAADIGNDRPARGTLFYGQPRKHEGIDPLSDPLLSDDQGNQVKPLRDAQGNQILDSAGRPQYYYTGIKLPGYEERPEDEWTFSLEVRTKSIWDIGQDLAFLAGDFICAVHPFELRSTLFYGKPHWDLAYGYIYRPNGTDVPASSFESILDRRYGRPLGGTSGAEAYMVNPNYTLGQRPGQPTARIATGERIKPFCQVHCVTDWKHILNNQITATENFFTNVIGVYTVGQAEGQHIPSTNIWTKMYDWMLGALSFQRGHTATTRTLGADPDIMSHIQRTFVTDLGIHFPLGWRQDEAKIKRAAIARLCRSLANMYDGSLLLRGDESIKPHDLIHLNDTLHQMCGTVGVRRVIHSMDLQSGYLTEVVPAALAVPQGSELSLIWARVSKPAAGLTAALLDRAMGGWIQRTVKRRIGLRLIELANKVDTIPDLDNVAKWKRGYYALIRKLQGPISAEEAVAETKRFVLGPTTQAIRRLEHWKVIGRDGWLNRTINYLATVDGHTLRQLFGGSGRSAIRQLFGRGAAGITRVGARLTRGVLLGGQKGANFARAGRWALRGSLNSLLIGILIDMGISVLVNSIQDFVSDRTDQAVLMPLQLHGRPYVAGIMGHRGLIIGEMPDVINRILREESWMGTVLRFILAM